MDRPLLLHRAKQLQFPLLPLIVVLNQYGAPRCVGLGELVMYAGHPTLGIAAGCAFATFLVQAYALDSPCNFARARPLVSPTMFIDDLWVGANASSSEQLCLRLASAAQALAEVISRELKCQVAIRKSATVGNTSQVQQAVQTALGRLAGSNTSSQSAGNPGVDLYAGGFRKFRRHQVTASNRRQKLRRRWAGC